MKRLFALLLVLIMILTLVACGGGTDPGTEAPEGGSSDEGGTPDQISGKTYDTGNFTAQIPDGWMENPVTDMWSDDPEALDPNGLQIIKDGSSAFDILTKAYVDIDYYGPETDMMTPSSEWYQEAADLAPITAGSTTWKGFTAVSGGNKMTVLYAGEAGAAQYQVVLWCNGDATIEASDAEVLAILKSLTPAA